LVYGVDKMVNWFAYEYYNKKFTLLSTVNNYNNF
jgi:hypothetical protein